MVSDKKQTKKETAYITDFKNYNLSSLFKNTV